MISDITLGQFFPGYSVLHKLDPRIKIIIAILSIVTIFFANNPITFLLVTLFAVLLVCISRISFAVIIRGIKPILLILLFTMVLNVFMTTAEGEPLIEFWIIRVYTYGIIRAIFMAWRVILLIVITSMLLTYTTSPISLTDGLESLLSPLKAIGVPVHTFAMMMSIALRFIPTLIEETEKIMNAQKSRGADFSTGSLVKRAKALIPLLIPLIVSSFKRAEELATAMECRCYRGDKNRTKLVKLELRMRDYVCLVFSVILLAVIILGSVLPYNLPIEFAFYDLLFYKI